MLKNAKWKSEVKLSNYLQIKKVKKLAAVKISDKQHIHLTKKADYEMKCYYVSKLRILNKWRTVDEAIRKQLKISSKVNIIIK